MSMTRTKERPNERESFSSTNVHARWYLANRPIITHIVQTGIDIQAEGCMHKTLLLLPVGQSGIGM